jgi:hypothetical protein
VIISDELLNNLCELHRDELREVRRSELIKTISLLRYGGTISDLTKRLREVSQEGFYEDHE